MTAMASMPVEGGTAQCAVHVAQPQGHPVAGVIIGHESYGLNADIP